MERNALVAVAISIAILLLYYEVLLPRLYPPPPKLAQPELAAPGEGGEADSGAVRETEPAPFESAPPAAAAAAIVNAPEVTVETDLYTAVFTAAGGRLRSLSLKRYPTTTKPDSPPLEMVIPGANGQLPLGLELRGAQTIGDAGALYEIRGGPLKLQGDEEGTLVLAWQADGVDLEKRLRFKGNEYPIHLEVVPAQLPSGTKRLDLDWVKGIPPAHGTQQTGVFQGVIALVNNKLEHKNFPDLEKGENLKGPVGWVGYGSTYFLSAIVPDNGENMDLWLRFQGNTANARVLAPLEGPQPLAFELYLGPKDTEDLEAAGHGLQKAIDLGYFTFIAIPMLQVLRLLHYLTGNWGVAIILLTVAVKVLFIPLTQKSFVSMRQMQKLQPQMQQLRERLKDSPEQMNKEIMELYRRHKVNPLSGCLPMLLQIPVFVGLYNALNNAIELRHAPFMLWITDLSSPDRLGSLPLPFVDPPGIPVLTIIMGLSMLVQQWMTPAAGDPMQQRMMMIMPVIFTFMFINFPAGLVLYWLVNNVLTIAQQYVMLRRADK